MAFSFKPGGSAALTGSRRGWSAAVPASTLQDEICVTQAVQRVPAPGDDLLAPVWDTDVLGANPPLAQDKVALCDGPKDPWRGHEPWQMWSLPQSKAGSPQRPPNRNVPFYNCHIAHCSELCLPGPRAGTNNPALGFHSCSSLPASSKRRKLEQNQQHLAQFLTLLNGQALGTVRLLPLECWVLLFPPLQHIPNA